MLPSVCTLGLFPHPCQLTYSHHPLLSLSLSLYTPHEKETRMEREREGEGEQKNIRNLVIFSPSCPLQSENAGH
jgi:hypothetical protein